MATAVVDDEEKRFMFRLSVHYYAWKSLVWNRQYSAMLDENAYNCRNKLEIGHPKFDVSIDMLTESEKEVIRGVKARSEGKKIIFWNTSFKLENVSCGGAFLDYGMRFLEYVRQQDDIFLYWRPHPMFFSSLQKYGCFASVMEMIKTFPSDKLYLDTGESQWPAVFVSDLLISDVSGVIESYILTSKPIVLTTKGNILIQSKDILYHAWGFKSLVQVLQSFREAGDWLFDKRMHYIKENYFMDAGKSVAEKIVDVMTCDN